MNTNSEHYKPYICIGVQRSATTWLYKTLHQATPFILPKIKEIDYFRYLGNYSLGRDWYLSRFSTDPQALNIDITPEYSIAEETPNLIKKEFGSDIHVILILRDPIDRIVSSYHKHARNKDLLCDFEFYVKYNIDCCIERVKYTNVLARFSDFTNISLLVYEDMLFNPEIWIESINKIFNTDLTTAAISNKYNPTSGSSTGARKYANNAYRKLKNLPGVASIKNKLESSATGNKLLYGGDSKDFDLHNALKENNYIKELYLEERTTIGERLNRDLKDIWPHF